MPPSDLVVTGSQAESHDLTEHRAPKSRALSTIAGYFNVVAVLNGVSWLVFLAVVYTAPTRFARLLPFLPWRTVGMIATVAMQFRVGQLLHRRSREGGVWAVAALLPSLINGIRHQSSPVTNYYMAISLVGLGLVALVWKELE